MTAYLTFKAIRSGKLTLEQKIPCSLVATLQPPSKVGLNVGAEMSVEKALQAIIIKSANDVTVMLAEAVSGSETKFVAEMNAAARQLGMSRTHFANTNGLPDPSQITTARDLAKLARAVVTEFPEYASFWSMTDMRIGNKRLGSHNALLKTFPGADGLKTGFTCDSGFNVVASATRDGRRLMAVVLGEASGNERAVRAASLLEHGFQTQGWKNLFNQSSIDNMPIDPAAKGIVSVREEVVAWSCNNKKRQTANPPAQPKKTAKSKGVSDKSHETVKKKATATDARPALRGTQTDPGAPVATAADGKPGAN
jgi:D-alanyl-D-alanine carboxypeptidase